MAQIRPLRALHYAADDLQNASSRRPTTSSTTSSAPTLASRSPHNVVEIDLPQGDEPYDAAARTFADWQDAGRPRRATRSPRSGS